MQNHSLKKLLLIIIVLMLTLTAFIGGALTGLFLPRPKAGSLPISLPFLPTEEPPVNASPVELQDLFEPFWETWKIVNSQFVDRKTLNPEKMMQGAIRGLMGSLDDPHSSYMDPDQFSQASAPLKGEYEGIGAYVDSDSEFLTIVSPMPGSPAEKAGLAAGDAIIAVDGQDVSGLDASLVLRQVLGPAGTDVTLTIRREGKEPFDVTITRARIVLPSIEGKMLEDDIAYVRIHTFGNTTADDLHTTLKTLLKENPRGLVLDLRNNGGGYLNTAIDVVSEFIEGGQPALYEQMADGKDRVFKTSRGGIATKIPLVVLVNEGTASASEITAGAIQDYARGKLVGVTTFGKGSVQNWIPLNNNQGAVRVTIARWFTPKHRAIHEVGLAPDVEIKMTEDDFKNNRDPQLEAAVKLLK